MYKQKHLKHSFSYFGTCMPVSGIVHPQFKRDADQLERIKKKATRRIKGLEMVPSSERVQELYLCHLSKTQFRGGDLSQHITGVAKLPNLAANKIITWSQNTLRRACPHCIPEFSLQFKDCTTVFCKSQIC